MTINDEDVISIIAFTNIGEFFIMGDALLYVIEENAFYINEYAPALKSNLPYTQLVNKNGPKEYVLHIDSVVHIFKGLLVFNKDCLPNDLLNRYVKMEVDIKEAFQNTESYNKYLLFQSLSKGDWETAHERFEKVMESVDKKPDVDPWQMPFKFQ